MDVRKMIDPQTRNTFYPQTHYLAVSGLRTFVEGLIKEKQNEYATYVSDVKLIRTPGHFYFDENTLNKPANVPKGILRAVFIDKNNGIIEVLTTNYYFNITGGIVSDIQERT